MYVVRPSDLGLRRYSCGCVLSASGVMWVAVDACCTDLV